MTVLDQYGRPISTKDLKAYSESRPLYAPKRERFYTYPKRGITPGKLDSILREADMGYPARQVELFREIEETDAHVASQVGTRRGAVMRLKYELQPGGDDPKNLKAYELCKEMFEGLQADDLVEDLIEAALQGWSMTELFWDVSMGQAVITRAADVPQEYSIFDDHGLPRLATDDEPTQGVELPPGKFVFHQHRRKGRPVRTGIMRTVCWWWLFKSFDVKDWMAFAEVFGMPLRVGKYPHGTPKDDVNILARALQNLGSDAAAVISDVMSIDFHESKISGGGTTVFERIFDKMEAQISKAVLGQTLTTDVGQGRVIRRRPGA